jgi:hypothetical protein
VKVYGSSPLDWSPNAVLARIEPRWMFTFAHHPEQFPE